MQNEENKPGEEVLKRPEEENLSLTEQARVYPIELTPGRIWLVNRDGDRPERAGLKVSDDSRIVRIVLRSGRFLFLRGL